VFSSYEDLKNKKNMFMSSYIIFTHTVFRRQTRRNSMKDRYIKVILTIIAINLTLMTSFQLLDVFIPNAIASDMHITGGKLDYETDMQSGPTLFVHCTNCD
jgi:hypothetical protein